MTKFAIRDVISRDVISGDDISGDGLPKRKTPNIPGVFTLFLC
jgi:hypothetical protein